MDRQSKRNSNYEPNHNLSRWDFGENKHADIFRYLYNNINLYDHAYKHEAQAFKRDSNLSIMNENKRNKSLVPSQHLISVTESISKSYCKKRVKQDGKRMVTEQNELDGNLENFNVNLVMNLRELRGKYSESVHTSVSVKNMEFNKNSREYIRKKERYRQIFGEKPKFKLVKADDLESLTRNKVSGSVTLFKPR